MELLDGVRQRYNLLERLNEKGGRTSETAFGGDVRSTLLARGAGTVLDYVEPVLVAIVFQPALKHRFRPRQI